MSLERKLIREAAVAVLKGNTDAGDRVLGNPFLRLPQDQVYPVILVYALDEEISVHTEAPRKYRRDLSLATRVVIDLTGADPMGRMDELAGAIESLIASSGRLLGTASDDPMLKRVEIDFDSDGETPVGMADIVWTVPYLMELPSLSDSELVPLLQIHAEHEAVVAESSAVASDDILLDQ